MAYLPALKGNYQQFKEEAIFYSRVFNSLATRLNKVQGIQISHGITKLHWTQNDVQVALGEILARHRHGCYSYPSYDTIASYDTVVSTLSEFFGVENPESYIGSNMQQAAQKLQKSSRHLRRILTLLDKDSTITIKTPS